MKYTGTLIAVKDIEKSKRFYHDALGLEVMGSGGIAAGLQHGGELLRLHGAVAEFPQRISLRGQFRKIHGDASFLM